MKLLIFSLFIASFFIFATSQDNINIESKVVELSSEYFRTKVNGDKYILQLKEPLFMTIDGSLIVSGEKVDLKIAGVKDDFSFIYTQVDFERYIKRFLKLTTHIKENRKDILELIEEFAPSIDTNHIINH